MGLRERRPSGPKAKIFPTISIFPLDRRRGRARRAAQESAQTATKPLILLIVQRSTKPPRRALML